METQHSRTAMQRPAGTATPYPLSILICLLASTIFASSVKADLYKWVDENGKTHYSDKSPKTHDSSMIAPELTQRQQVKHRSSQLVPITLPYEKKSRKMLVSDVKYNWTRPGTGKKKLGVYYLGRFCTSRGAIYSPDVYSNHAKLFPGESTIPMTIRRAIDKLGYESQSSKLHELSIRMQKKNRLYLKAEVNDLEIHSCAPIYSLTRTISTKEIPWSNFTHNRASVNVQWSLFDELDTAPIFNTSTSGYVDNWKIKQLTNKTIEQALTIATNNLFSHQQFVDLITYQGPVEASSNKPINNNPEKTDSKWWKKVIPDIYPDNKP